MIQHATLPEGATLLAELRQGSVSFSIALWFSAGSRNEAPQTAGFVHFIEHMLFKGTAFRDSRTLWRDIERTGGYVNGFTDRDSLCVQASVPSRHWRIALDLVVEAAFASTFPPAEFERERKVILAEILQVEDDAEESAYDAFLERYWEGNAAALPIAGKASGIASACRDEVYACYLDIATPDKALITVSGDVIPESLGEALSASIGKAMEARNQQGSSSSSYLIPARTPEPRCFDGFTIDRSLTQVYYHEGYQLAQPMSLDEYAGFSILHTLIGESSTSRLFRRVRETMGLAYTIQSSLSFSRHEALFLIQAVTGVGNLSLCVDAVKEELDSLFIKGVEEEEFEDAKMRLSGAFAISLEDSESRIRRMAAWYLSFGFLPTLEREQELYETVTPELVNRMVIRLAHAPRARYAYGKMRRAIAGKIGFTEMGNG